MPSIAMCASLSIPIGSSRITRKCIFCCDSAMWKGEETQMGFRKGCVSKNIFWQKQPLTHNSPPLTRSLPYWFHQQRNGGKQQESDWFLPSPSSFWAPLSFAPSSSPWTWTRTLPADDKDSDSLTSNGQTLLRRDELTRGIRVLRQNPRNEYGFVWICMDL